MVAAFFLLGCYVHNFWIKEETRIGAKPGIKRKDMDLIEEILTFRYRFFEETQPPKSLKDYKYFYD